jgi:hypothetical protein
MEKPFDFKALAEKLKSEGLPMAEAAAEKLAAAVFAWTEESLAIHPNVLVKGIGLPAVAILKPLALGAIDKIDGQPG